MKIKKIDYKQVDLKVYKAQSTVRRRESVSGPDIVVASDADSD